MNGGSAFGSHLEASPRELPNPVAVCDDSVTIGEPHGAAGPTSRACLVCGTAVPRTGRRCYCSRACQERAYRLRHQPEQQGIPADLGAHVAVERRLRQHTIYRCGSCEQRYLGQRRCPDCQLWCTKLGVGGLCPHCDEPVVVIELLEGELS